MMQTILISGCNMGLTTSEHIKKKGNIFARYFNRTLKKSHFNFVIKTQTGKLSLFFKKNLNVTCNAIAQL
jgi:hypothetical protein